MTPIRLAALPFLGVAAQAAEVPPEIRAAGTLRPSTNAVYPPMAFKEPATDQLAGLDIDLGPALAAKLGLATA